MNEAEGTILWVAADAGSREMAEGVAREFRLGALFRTPDQVFEAIREQRCDLIVLELPLEPRGALALLKDIHERLPRVTIFAASADPSVSVIRAAIEAGAGDFLSLPINRSELHKALIKFTQTGMRGAVAREVLGDVIVIYGARGGLGATTIAVNVAVQLASATSAQVALVDLDLQRGDVAAFLNLTPVQSIASIATARSEVDEIFLHGTLTRHPSGVFVLPAPPQIDEADTVAHDDVVLALRLLRAQFRYTVVDTSRTITPATIAAFEHADRVLVLTDLSVPGVRATRRMVELLGHLGSASAMVELLITHAVPGPVELRAAVAAIGKQPLVVLPRDESAARNAMNAGAPLNGLKPVGLSLAIAELAAKLSGMRVGPPPKGSGLLRRFFNKEARTG